ncbi:MAG: glycosyltransferase family 2 protein [Oscillospiraceae bacterium]|jgi:glycosyltransferase involved in cell wall biosynthesis|nr:glycosyltransferase family 2 protein [Oscillospiraceae bacterium]
MKKISIVVPCYNEEDVLSIFYKEINKTLLKLTQYDYEIIFVDDGSRDGTLSIMTKLSNADSHVRYISFSRNFGKESAMYAGLEHSSGDYAVIMDADLQDPPELLIPMIKTLESEDYDCVGTRRVTRKGEPPIRSFFARMFYRVMNKISDVDIISGARDYRMMRREMVDAVIDMKEYSRFSKGLFSWVGFKTKWIEYENIERAAGETKWSFWNLLVYSIEGIVAFSTRPLMISLVLGILLCFVSVLLAIVFAAKSSLDMLALIFCTVLMLGGVQLLCIGIMGKYLDKTYLEVKARPKYLISEKNVEKYNGKHSE